MIKPARLWAVTTLMKRSLFILLVILSFGVQAQAPYAGTFPSTLPAAQSQVTLALDSTPLPIVAIKLPFLWPPWDPIPDTPKISANMGIINYGYNVMNHITDPVNEYKGKIGIEKRGSISQFVWFLQKSYGFETRDISGADSDAVILGMPPEHDWVLYGPYDDETLMRNVLMYRLGRELGPWTPRTKHCEVQFYDYLWQPDYRGVYVMMEKIKRDNARVNIAKLDTNENAGDNMTGGYIFAVDKNIWANDSGWKSTLDTGVFFTYKYPKASDITLQQKTYLKALVDSFETTLQGPNFANPVTGYNKFIDPASFIDFFIMQEFSKSIDAFRRSAYLHKNKNSNGGKIKAGPLWDFNSALFNAQLCTFEQDTGWAYKTTCWVNQGYHVPFWWGKLLQDPNYRNQLKCRWDQLRSSTLDTTNIWGIIDSIRTYIKPGSVRHFTRYDFGYSIDGQCDTLKWWIKKRLNWLDQKMPGTCILAEKNEVNLRGLNFNIHPNPAQTFFEIEFGTGGVRNFSLRMMDVYGRKVKEESIHSGNSLYVRRNLAVDDLPPGIYFVELSGEGKSEVKKVVVER